MKLSNMTVRNRLKIGFSLLLALLLLVTVIGLNRMGQIQARLHNIVNVNNVETQQVLTMRITVYDRMIAVRNLALMTETSEMQAELDRLKTNLTSYVAAETELNNMLAASGQPRAEQKTLLAKIKESETAALPLIAKATELGLQNKSAEATTVLVKELRPIQRQWTDGITALVKFEEQQNARDMQSAEDQYASARILMISLASVALLIGLAAALLISRSLAQQLGGEPTYAAEIANKIAGGDLTVAVLVRPNDTSSLIYSMNQMRDNLANIVGQVRMGTDTIATASAEIASGNLDLSSRTEQQASSLEETASSMEELTATVKQNADNARQANILAKSASEVAVKGGAVVSQVVETMGSINESAKKITDIISVIDGIAFQTNILALNAAVEAARAGEQGRGFAVVASEVRSLAQRSAAAAKEIKILIADSVDKVDSGSKLVDEAGHTMIEIVNSVKRVTDIMGEITSASQEQTAGIEQINQAITQMDEVTQQNAALVEQAAAAAQSLQDQAGALSSVVGIFQVAGGTAQRLTTPVRQSAPQRTMTARRAPIIAKPATSTTRALPGTAKTGTDNSDWEEF
ncbi:methyl-accepting chemotaxis protein [Actimicrobium antarcticum]|uniref:Methyl-accepting chemotaxis protein n=1 Tax=Actimicrobium antarcticum TaxID=1051899 RepID=A0ABP7SJA1_9BURK